MNLQRKVILFIKKYKKELKGIRWIENTFKLQKIRLK